VIKLRVNGTKHKIDADPEIPLAWVLRDKPGLTSAHVACAIGVYGAHYDHLDGQATRSCSIRAGAVQGRAITIIEGLFEGLSDDGSQPVQKAWIQDDVVQHGYRQSGFIGRPRRPLRCIDVRPTRISTNH
jgi:isoquinoline 1-oxidoreductase subunit alpha